MAEAIGKIKFPPLYGIPEPGHTGGFSEVRIATAARVPPSAARTQSRFCAMLRKPLTSVDVRTLNLPTLSQKHQELTDCENAYAALFGQRNLDAGGVQRLQDLALNISRVYALGIYDGDGNALLPPDVGKSLGVLHDTIGHIEKGGKADSMLYYTLGKQLMFTARQLEDAGMNKTDADAVRTAAMDHFATSRDFPGSAFAILAYSHVHKLTTKAGIEGFQAEILTLPPPSEDRAYYAGKFFRDLAKDPGSGIWAGTYAKLSTKYFKKARGAAAYREMKSNAYRAADVLAENAEKHQKRTRPGDAGTLKSILAGGGASFPFGFSKKEQEFCAGTPRRSVMQDFGGCALFEVANTR